MTNNNERHSACLPLQSRSILVDTLQKTVEVMNHEQHAATV